MIKITDTTSANTEMVWACGKDEGRGRSERDCMEPAGVEVREGGKGLEVTIK